MNLVKWIYNKIYGKKDQMIEQLNQRIVEIKKEKQIHIERQDAYWKRQVNYKKKSKPKYPQAGDPR